MRSFSAAVLTAALAQFASAHGNVASVSVGGTKYTGYVPSNAPGSQPKPAKGVVWASSNYENGFVLPSAYSDPSIICHINALPAPEAATVAAGGTISLSWPNWPATDPHPGVFLNYLAPAGTDEPSKIVKDNLKFFKISQQGYDPSVAANGDDKGLATGSFKKAGRVAQVTIPADIKAGTYVLRHEIIALHEAEQKDKAQNYPQCVTIKVTGGGSAVPAGVAGTALYKNTEPGILVKNFYGKWDPKTYPMPGPALYNGATGTVAAAVESVASGTESAASSAGSALTATTGTEVTETTDDSEPAPAAASSTTSDDSSSGSSGSSSSSSGSGRRKYRNGGRSRKQRTERRHARDLTLA